MMENQFGKLLADLWADLQEPAILWQIGTLALCLIAAWWLGRLLQWRAPADSREALKRGAAAYRRVLFPLLAMLLLVAGRAALGHWHKTNLLSVAIPLFGALAGIRCAVYLLRLGIPRATWLDGFERWIAAVVWAALALHLTGLLPEIVRWLSDVQLSAGTREFSLWSLLNAAFWVGMTLLLALWAGAALENRLMRAESLHSSLRVMFARLGRAVLLVAAVLLALPLLGVDLTVLSVFGGALGVGLGLGLQKIASNYLSGFIILLDRSIRLGDMITADGHHGEVTRITTRYTVVRSLTGVEAIIPNDSLVTTTVLNHSYTDRRVRLAVRVQVAYGTEMEAVLKLMLEIARRQPRVLKEPEPTVQVLQLGDSGVDLELGFWIEDPERGSQNLRSDISLALLAEFRSRGIEIPYPQREVRLLQGNNATAAGNTAGT
ncbi:MAG TPA: mechanosensitive ion channel domain-containing protein [Burkholderiales bacterium]|jgi:small-conductance mechanosensitive channel|nr:mechanosensitive ion channel domain-containing protein [Burkholderiales bacterium]